MEQTTPTRYKVQCARTGKVLPRTWKTYRGAVDNITVPSQFVTTPEGIKWALNHPVEHAEWCKTRLRHLIQPIV